MPKSPTSDRVHAALRSLISFKPRKVPAAAPQPPQEFPACAPPDVRTPPQFVVPYARYNPAERLDLAGSELRLAGVKADPQTGLEFSLGFTLKFEQTWNLRPLPGPDGTAKAPIGIGDLSSTIALAPLEKLTLEFQNSQRRVLEQTRVESAEEMDSTESATIDKEVLNVVRAASKTNSWHIDANGQYNGGGFLLGIQAGIQEQVQTNSQATVEHISESTRKSAHSLKTLHKIEVRGVSEELIQNRMTRVIRNPYPDRTLCLNVFQLIKRFSVETRLVQIQPALRLQVKELSFDTDFVKSNSGFLLDKLLDQPLIDELPSALNGARPFLQPDAQARAQEAALLALRYLFDNPPNIFRVRRIFGDIDSNDPGTSFEAANEEHHPWEEFDGLDDALGASDQERDPNIPYIFTTLGYFYRIYKEMQSEPPPSARLADNAIALAIALEDGFKGKWPLAGGDDKINRYILDANQFTEVFRRLSGFMTFVSGVLKPMIAPATMEQEEARKHGLEVHAFERLKTHLNNHKNYYIQQYLVDIAGKTTNQAIIDFVNCVIETYTPPGGDGEESRLLLKSLFDVNRAYIDRQGIVVPALVSIDDQALSDLFTALTGQPVPPFSVDDIPPRTIEVDVPADGIHLEVAEGACRLSNVPAIPSGSVDLELHNASFKLNTPD